MDKLCNDDNVVIFDKTSVKPIAHNQEIADIIKAQPIIFEEKRNYADRLWAQNISPELSGFKRKLTEDNFSIHNIYPSIYRSRKIARVEDKHTFRPVKKKLQTKVIFSNNIDQLLKSQQE